MEFAAHRMQRRAVSSAIANKAETNEGSVARGPSDYRVAYRPGTGMGGRNDDRDVIAAGDGLAAAARDRPRCVLSTDSR
jgi:beta-lactamase class A